MSIDKIPTFLQAFNVVRLLNERTVSSSNIIWNLVTIRRARMDIFFFDFEVQVASQAHYTASHE